MNDRTKDYIPVEIDTRKISAAPSATQFKMHAIQEYLEGLLGKKKPLEVGRIATTIAGKYAHTGMMIVDIDGENVVLQPSPDSIETITLSSKEVYMFSDYDDAFQIGLFEEQTFNPDQPQ